MIDNYFIKVKGKANIPEPLSIGHNFLIENNCSITSEQKIDNEDGSFDWVFAAEIITTEIRKDNGEVIKGKDTRRNSEKIYKYLWKLWSEEGYTEPIDQVYDAFSIEVMIYAPQLLRDAIKRLKK